MTMLGVALIVGFSFAYLAFYQLLEFKKAVYLPKVSAQPLPAEQLKEITEEIARIKLMLGIRTFKSTGGEKK
jgi:hypothetical protein